VPVDDLPLATFAPEDRRGAQHLGLGLGAVDRRGGVLQGDGVGEVAAGPAATISFSYDRQFENCSPSASKIGPI
jgi:hypothetical protein